MRLPRGREISAHRKDQFDLEGEKTLLAAHVGNPNRSTRVFALTHNNRGDSLQLTINHPKNWIGCLLGF